MKVVLLFFVAVCLFLLHFSKALFSNLSVFEYYYEYLVLALTKRLSSHNIGSGIYSLSNKPSQHKISIGMVTIQSTKYVFCTHMLNLTWYETVGCQIQCKCLCRQVEQRYFKHTKDTWDKTVERLVFPFIKVMQGHNRNNHIAHFSPLFSTHVHNVSTKDCNDRKNSGRLTCWAACHVLSMACCTFSETLDKLKLVLFTTSAISLIRDIKGICRLNMSSRWRKGQKINEIWIWKVAIWNDTTYC